MGWFYGKRALPHASENDGSDVLRPASSYLKRGALWVVIQFALFALFVVACASDGPRIIRFPWGLIPGMILVVVGLTLMGLAFAKLTEAQTMTMLPTPLGGAQLASTGVFARVRHPNYASLLLALVGVSVLTGLLYPLIVTSLLAVFFWTKAAHEEALLLELDLDYAQYRDNVPWRFVPGMC